MYYSIFFNSKHILLFLLSENKFKTKYLTNSPHLTSSATLNHVLTTSSQNYYNYNYFIIITTSSQNYYNHPSHSWSFLFSSLSRKPLPDESSQNTISIVSFPSEKCQQFSIASYRVCQSPMQSGLNLSSLCSPIATLHPAISSHSPPPAPIPCQFLPPCLHLDLATPLSSQICPLFSFTTLLNPFLISFSLFFPISVFALVLFCS